MSLESARAQKEMVSIRDTVQSIWIAIVMAFVLRAFMVEAFVIPTGSMAAGLNGEHYDLVCPACGFHYTFGWSAGSGASVRSGLDRPTGAVCPNCHFPYVHVSDPDHRTAWVNGGDRVLVLKYVYPLREPEPFDVIVFRNPQNNSENYIKRLIGLPGESIELVHGDVYVTRSEKTDDPSVWQIRRKPAYAQARMWHVVHDSDYPPREQWVLSGGRDVPRWVGDEGDAERWAATQSRAQWSYLGPDGARMTLKARREHFMPLYAYNNPDMTGGGIYQGADVCDDLRLSLVYLPQDAAASLGMEIRGVLWQWRAVIQTGTIALLRAPRGSDDWQPWGPPATIGPLATGRGYHLELIHSDCRVQVLLDGRVVLEQTYPGEYVRLKDRLKHFLEGRQEAADLFPDPVVALSGEGGKFDLRHLRVDRDVYYSSQKLRTEFDVADMQYFRRLEVLADRSDRPVGGVNPHEDSRRGWAATGRPIHLQKNPDNPDLDSFFVLGDNSPASLDGRMWTRAAPSLRLWKDPDERTQPLYQLGTVPRYNLIGKAVFVYWPSGYRIPVVQLPIIPNVGKMRTVH